ncbi:MAG: glycosyltransferase [Sedimentisphaerales bacterium]
MAINTILRNQFKTRLITKLHLARVSLFPLITIEKMNRALNHDSLMVYFRYKYHSLDIHPWFDRYYRFPPANYCNFKQAKCYHWITYPDVTNETPFIVEPNDHPLSVVGVLPSVPLEPADVLMHKDRAIELVYQNPQCKKICVESRGQWELFQRYCSDVLNKCEIIRLGTIPKQSYFDNAADSIYKINFLCLASDFINKGVDLLLDAWFEFPGRKTHQLTLACPYVPEKYKKRASCENVRLILKAPLSSKEKETLCRDAHVAIAPLHVDGGGNVMEAMEYGLPIITMRSQRSHDQIMNNNGIVVDVPFYFYDEGYGTKWPTWADFFRLLEKAKSRGDFDQTKDGFVKAFTFFADNPDKIIEMGKRSHELAKNEYSLTLRNQQLRRIYQDILIDQS